MEEKDRRTTEAKKAFCRAAEENGIEVCAWEELAGYNSYMNGEITESQLAEQARQEMSQIAQTFSKYMAVKKDESPAEKESLKRKKAKEASKIYKKACLDSGKDSCFFRSFSTWHEFVEGRIDDSQLYEKAVEEVRKLAEDS